MAKAIQPETQCPEDEIQHPPEKTPETGAGPARQ
jgi:hypothetical protein